MVVTGCGDMDVTIAQEDKYDEKKLAFVGHPLCDDAHFLAFLFMVERCRNLCGVLSRQLGNGDCTGTGNGFLFVVEYSVCEGIPSWDGSGLCPFGK